MRRVISKDREDRVIFYESEGQGRTPYIYFEDIIKKAIFEKINVTITLKNGHSFTGIIEDAYGIIHMMSEDLIPPVQEYDKETGIPIKQKRCYNHHSLLFDDISSISLLNIQVDQITTYV